MEDILNAAQEKINKAIEEEQAQGINYNNDTQPESTVKPSSVPEGTINHNPEALEMTEGTVDIINTELSEENLFWLAYANSMVKYQVIKLPQVLYQKEYTSI